MFILAVQQLKEKTETASEERLSYEPVWTTENIIDNLPYSLTGA